MNSILLFIFWQTTSLPYGAQYYVYLGADKELQINVQIWGEVKNPGMYSVPKTTDVIGLISFAGGPTQDADLGKIKIIRSSNPERNIISVNLNSYIKGKLKKELPVLEPGDVIIIPRNLLSKTKYFLSFLGNISYILGIVNFLILAGVIKV